MPAALAAALDGGLQVPPQLLGRQLLGHRQEKPKYLLVHLRSASAVITCRCFAAFRRPGLFGACGRAAIEVLV